MSSDQNDLEFQRVLDMGINEMQSVPIESSIQETQGSSNINFANSSIFSLNYYKQFFDVNNEDVLRRLIMAVNFVDNSFIANVQNPDLYGPIWVSFTAPFLMLIFGNIAAWTEKGDSWKFNFYPFVVAAMLTFAYVFGAPFLLRWFTRFINPPTVFQLICLLGYSVAFMVPTGFVCLIVGLKAHKIFCYIGAAAMGASIFMKLNRSFDAPSVALVPNIVMSVGGALVCIIVEAMLFR